MPVYNEIGTLEEIIRRVRAVRLSVTADSATDSEGSPAQLDKEIIIVDDGSTDGTRELLDGFDDSRVRILLQPENRGKGAAIRRGFEVASAEFVIVQDADLEYDPRDYDIVLEPLLSGSADVVYGSRFQSGRPRRVLYFWHSVGNRFLTLLSNMFTDLNLTDMETCYKAFRIEVLQSLDLREDRFGIEPVKYGVTTRRRQRPSAGSP